MWPPHPTKQTPWPPLCKKNKSTFAPDPWCRCYEIPRTTYTKLQVAKHPISVSLIQNGFTFLCFYNVLKTWWMKAWQSSPDFTAQSKTLAHVHGFSCCWHDEKNKNNFFRFRLYAQLCEAIHIIQLDAKKEHDLHVTSACRCICFHPSDRSNLSRSRKAVH